MKQAMGQSTTKPRKKRESDTSKKKSNEETKIEVTTEIKGVARSRTELLQEFNIQREQLLAALKIITSTAIQPNGIFPAEIIDMILKNVDESKAQFEIASCCKLWLDVTLSKSYDWFLRRRFARSNIENGLFWPTLLMHQCQDRNANYEFSCDWALKNNNILILKKQFYYNRQEGEDKKIGFTKTICFNLSTNEEIEVENSFYEELFAISQKIIPKICISTKQNLKAVCGDQSTILISTTEDKFIKRIDIDKAANIPLKSNEFIKVVSVAFDERKLVAVSHGYRWREGQSYMSLLEVSDVLISVFDLTDDYRHLNTVKTNLNCDPSISSCPVYITLPASGKILINAKDAGLLEINFLHPNLMKNTIKIAQFSRKEGKGVIQAISVLDLTEHVLQQFRAKLNNNLTLGAISTTTYFLQDPSQRKTRAILDPSMNIPDDIFDVTRSQTKRITFIYPVNLQAALRNQDSTFDWMNNEEFDRHWEIRHDYFSTLHLTTLDLSKGHQAHTPRFLPKHMWGDIFFMLFEEFDAQTNQWLITDPFVPHGTNLTFNEAKLL